MAGVEQVVVESQTLIEREKKNFWRNPNGKNSSKNKCKNGNYNFYRLEIDWGNKDMWSIYFYIYFGTTWVWHPNKKRQKNEIILKIIFFSTYIFRNISSRFYFDKEFYKKFEII